MEALRLCYYPSPDLKITWSETDPKFVVSNKDIALTIEVDESTKSQYENVISNIKVGNISDSPEQEFLSFFKDYPLVVLQPRTMNLQKPYKVKSTVNSPEELFLAAMELTSESIKIPDWLPEKFSSNYEDLIEKCTILNSDQFCDPITVYGRILNTTKEVTNIKFSKSAPQLLRERLGTDEDKFFGLAAQIVRQTLYVTGKCFDSLSPAETSNPEYANEVSDYCKSEIGHDLLVLKTLRKLTNDSDEKIYEIPVQAETKISMALLKWRYHAIPLAI